MTSPAHTGTLDELFTRKAAELAPTDLLLIVEGLRAQRDQWNANQNTGSRKRVTSKQVQVGPADTKPTTSKSGKKKAPLPLENLML